MRNKSVKVIFQFGPAVQETLYKRFILSPLLFGGAELLMQYWKKVSWRIFMWSYLKFGPAVQKMSFKEKIYGQRTTDDRRQT